ncbi:hypothetical protein F511_19957 [Dorcoceras hygrometricum]|uniref:Uncharacterized protein n=1 Tax=Dorcoceras hygrometricum TaxID=472368 RepID=A0A2Z7CTL0_9LAMI|nr:hypothetical protein F511_19957 [Dorcoceras hygrometricum]
MSHQTLHDRRLTLTRLPTQLRSSGDGVGCVLGKWVYLITNAMSLFDLQDVCMVIGSLATLDLPMVVDLIRIFELKGPYCTLTMTDWFLQALSVIPRGSWGDVARCFTMIRWLLVLVSAGLGNFFRSGNWLVEEREVAAVRVLRRFGRTTFWFRLLPESSGFLAGLVVAQYKDVRASGDTALSSPCWGRSHHEPSG